MIFLFQIKKRKVPDVYKRQVLKIMLWLRRLLYLIVILPVSYTHLAFQREIKEEIGLDIDASDATFVSIVPYRMDRIKEDGSIFRDRAFANVYVDLYEGTYEDFQMDAEEVSGIVIVNAKEALELFQKESGSILGREISLDNKMTTRDISFSEFLVNDGETALEKYGDVLKKIIELTSK